MTPNPQHAVPSVERARARATPARRRAAAGALEFVFASVALFACTIGPVYQVRMHLSPVSLGYLDDTSMTLVWASIYAVALALLARRADVLRGQRLWLLPAAGLHVVLLASTAWSEHQPRTFVYSTMFIGTTVLALWLGLALDVTKLTAALALATQAGCVWSAWAIERRWIGSQDENAHWAGVYLNRNSLAPVAALALVATVALVAVALERRRNQPRRGIRLICVVCAVPLLYLDARLLNGSRSGGAVAGLLIGAVSVATLSALRTARRRGWWTRSAPWAFAAVMTAVATAGWLFRWRLVALGDRDRTLNGRTYIWRQMRVWIGERPLLGHGWMAVWGVPARQTYFRAQFGIPVVYGHNSYLEVALGAGIVGALALASCLLVMTVVAVRTGLHGHGTAASVACFALFYGLTVNLFEDFIDANQLPWVLMMATFVACLRQRSGAIGVGSSSGLVVATRADG